AAALVEECLVMCREEGMFHLTDTLSLLGEIALQQGEASRARAFAEESLTLLQEVYCALDTVWALTLLGKVETALGNLAAARTAFEESLALAQRVGYQREVASSLEGLAEVAAVQHSPLWAAHLWGLAAAVREKIGAPLPPIERTRYEQAVAAACTELGEAAF